MLTLNSFSNFISVFGCLGNAIAPHRRMAVSYDAGFERIHYLVIVNLTLFETTVASMGEKSPWWCVTPILSSETDRGEIRRKSIKHLPSRAYCGWQARMRSASGQARTSHARRRERTIWKRCLHTFPPRLLSVCKCGNCARDIKLINITCVTPRQVHTL